MIFVFILNVLVVVVYPRAHLPKVFTSLPWMVGCRHGADTDTLISRYLYASCVIYEV